MNSEENFDLIKPRVWLWFEFNCYDHNTAVCLDFH